MSNIDNQKIKKVIEDIIFVPTQLRRKKQTKETKERNEFVSIIRALEQNNIKSNILNSIGIDISGYDDPLYEIIDKLLIMKYGQESYNLISFYIYDRLNPDGSLNSLVDANNNETLLKTPEDLWDAICEITK